MVVIVLERVSPSVRGELARWMVELKAGVFVGSMSAMVRERLWMLIGERLRGGGAILVYSMNNEQGFELRLQGEPDRTAVDYEGLVLIRRPQKLAKS